MNPVSILAQGIDHLWLWTYGLVAGWGITFTFLVAAVIFLLARQLRTERKLKKLEERLVHAERDYNISVNKWKTQ